MQTSKFNGVVYLSKADYDSLIANGSITKNGQTLTYNASTLYVTPDTVLEQYYVGNSQWDTTPTSSSTKPVTSGGIFDALSGKENTSNKVTSISSTSTDTQYPSAKCVFDNIKSKLPITWSVGQDINGGTGWYKFFSVSNNNQQHSDSNYLVIMQDGFNAVNYMGASLIANLYVHWSDNTSSVEEVQIRILANNGFYGVNSFLAYVPNGNQVDFYAYVSNIYDKLFFTLLSTNLFHGTHTYQIVESATSTNMPSNAVYKYDPIIQIYAGAPSNGNLSLAVQAIVGKYKKYYFFVKNSAGEWLNFPIFDYQLRNELTQYNGSIFAMDGYSNGYLIKPTISNGQYVFDITYQNGASYLQVFVEEN